MADELDRVAAGEETGRNAPARHNPLSRHEEVTKAG